MRYFLSLALVLSGLAFALCLAEQHSVNVYAAPSTRGAPALIAAAMTRERAQTPRANSKTGTQTTALPLVREINLEALKKILQRAPGKDARPILLNFWATWCEPCRDEFPDLVRIKADYETRNLDLITVSLDDPAEIKTSVPEFLRETGAGGMAAYLLNVIEPQEVVDAIDPQWGGGLPATFLFDPTGKIVFKHTGRFNAEELRKAIDKVTSTK
jgi:thiol-disulfide isomerase/thioredoxin